MELPVLIPKIFNHPFTYISDKKEPLLPGDVVIVPFGKKKEIGVIWDKIQSTNKKIKIKKIEKKINEISISKKLINFINWFSMYNMTSRGMVLKMCLGDEDNILKFKNNIEEIIPTNTKKYFLNDEQKNSLKELNSFGDQFNVSVLQGVTGSGKTLVYFEKIKKIIESNKQALVLLPEIFLTNQFKYRFLEFFGFEPSIWHSKISLKKKREIWRGVINNKIKLIVNIS